MTYTTKLINYNHWAHVWWVTLLWFTSYMDQFSRCLYVEYRRKGIDVQCQVWTILFLLWNISPSCSNSWDSNIYTILLGLLFPHRNISNYFVPSNNTLAFPWYPFCFWKCLNNGYQFIVIMIILHLVVGKPSDMIFSCCPEPDSYLSVGPGTEHYCTCVSWWCFQLPTVVDMHV